MRIRLMMALLAGSVLGAAALAPASVEAQQRLGRAVAAGKPSIARAKVQRPSTRTRSAASNRRSRPGFNGGSNLAKRPSRPNRPNRPVRPGGGRGPDKVVIVNGRPGAGYYDNGRYYGGNRYDDDGDNFLEFVGKTAAVTAGVSVVSAVIGSIVKDKPSDDCQQQIQNGKVYLLCDGVWYTPAVAEGQSGYEVVVPPDGAQ